MIEVKTLADSYLEKFDHDYNYAHFNADHLQYSCFSGPRVDEKIADFTLFKLNGEETRLSTIQGERTVIEFASYSCPNYRANREQMQELMETFAGVRFIVIYVREEHPGAHFYHHHSLTDKIAAAVRLKEELGERRDVYCDDIDGKMHKAMGAMPNSCLIINRVREVEYVANWMIPRHLQYILSGLVLEKSDRPLEGVVYPDSVSYKVLLRTYLDCGSLTDVISCLPEVLRKRRKCLKS